ncbi:MAG: alkaline phosphatase family protein, partial [Peptococcaceae bacterium]|nr:alkaline phosphatase family protein [Peptococcaceae bacterium]
MTNLERKERSNKILIVGIDGMDPRATERYMAEGKMPNVKKLLKMGAANEHLEMIGGHPTGTPPMWTTLATGCYANVHGITDFTLQSEKGPEYTCYGFDSRRCRAEQLWNVFAEAGKKTLVFHWPGSSWPPTSDSPNLHVIDGTEPIGVGFGTSKVGKEFFVIADTTIENLTFKRLGDAAGIAPCAIDGLDVESDDPRDSMSAQDAKHIVLDNREGTEGYIQYTSYEYSYSPVKDAAGWLNAPEDAKEFTILMSNGLLRRPCLMLKNENGIYDQVAMYASKKAEEPIVVLPKGELVANIFDKDYRGNELVDTVKSMRILEMADDGSAVRLFVSDSYDLKDDSIFSPKELHSKIVENVGYPQPVTMLVPDDGRGQDLFDCTVPMWDNYSDWMADTLHYLIESEGYDVVFSHNHNIDAQMHTIARNMKNRSFSQYSAETAQACMEAVYKQTDDYVGKFLHFVDEGWTVLLVSDHALVCPEYERPQICEGSGVHAGGIMRDLGFTVMIKDENGNDTHEIDWSKTKAINSRNNNI